ncbi:hypothetical protein HDV00_001620 [Rhizophlyctis rosea]|nr:hypothetical protein HDV00_001620 [Rhizophlyctis rosea]
MIKTQLSTFYLPTSDPKTLLRQSQQLWKTLDHLAAKSPKDYQSLLQSIQQSATLPQTRIATPAYAVKCTGTPKHGTKTHWINLCSSKAVKGVGGDDGSVPVVMGKIRVGRDKDDSLFITHDAVFSEDVVKKCRSDAFYLDQVIDLAVECVEETVGIELDKRGRTIKPSLYMGPYGWDAKGQPVESSIPPPVGSGNVQGQALDQLNMTPEELLKRVRDLEVDDGQDVGEADIVIGKAPLKKEEGRKLIVEVGGEEGEEERREGEEAVVALSESNETHPSSIPLANTPPPPTLNPPSTPPPPPPTPIPTTQPSTPSYTTKQTPTNLIFQISLPTITSQSQITLSSPTLTTLLLSAAPYTLTLNLAHHNIPTGASPTALFIKKNNVLKIKYPLPPS